MSDTPHSSAASTAQGIVDQAVTDGTAYEILSKRLTQQGKALEDFATVLNQGRIDEFGSSQMALLGRFRLRSENNCVGRDIVHVGDYLLFGYNVFIGLKQETRVDDVFSLYRLEESADGYDVVPQTLENSFLGQASFVQDFRELYTYYKGAKLLQLVVRDGKLLASFQIGERITDIRVFRWSVSPDGKNVRYLDNRGERDIALPAPYDFEWQKAEREHVVHGRHPHLNILDTAFVETINGTLTVKIENNTEDGDGIYSEAVADKTQSLDDANVYYAKLGSLLLLKILPYREETWRYLVFNTLTRKVTRIDAIGQACIQLPEDHGILFPGGYYLQNGETHAFDQQLDGMRYRRSIRSPNGEDVLYVFYEPASGRMALFTYNLIRRQLQPPLIGHGYARLEDGRMVIFSSESNEATRIHPMQIWQTPFASDEFASRQQQRTSFYGRIGNAELVRGISELFNLATETQTAEVSAGRYQRLIEATRRLFDRHHWLTQAEDGAVSKTLHDIVATGEAVLDEFEKVESIRAETERSLRDTHSRLKALLSQLKTRDWTAAHEYAQGMRAVTEERGRLLSLKDMRYVDASAIERMERDLLSAQSNLMEDTAVFLASPDAFSSYDTRLAALDQQAQTVPTASQLVTPLSEMQAISAELDTLSELMTSLKIDDATVRTAIVEAISAVYANVNQAIARGEQRRKSIGANEAVAQFGAQFTLFGQSIASALALAKDPERADEQLSRLLVQLEELESQFGEHEAFLSDIVSKREELLETFERHKQTLLDERQRKAQSVQDAALRILEGLSRRTERIQSADELNAFFVSDPLVRKLSEYVDRLRELKDSVKADDIEARLKAIKDQSLRTLRDRSELYDGDGTVIRFGRHRFSVNTQVLDLTLMPRGDTLNLHLIGTDYFAPLQREDFQSLREYWDVSLASESPRLYRSEYLALEIIKASENRQEDWSADKLRSLMLDGVALTQAIRGFAASRYRDGYERGIHDHDAALILQALVPLQDRVGVLGFAPDARSLALLFWAQRNSITAPLQAAAIAQWPDCARSAEDMSRLLGSNTARDALINEIAMALHAFVDREQLTVTAGLSETAAAYLVAELSLAAPRFSFSHFAPLLLQRLEQTLSATGRWHELLERLRGHHQQGALPLRLRWQEVTDWLYALCDDDTATEQKTAAQVWRHYVPEAAALLLTGDSLPHHVEQLDLEVKVSGLLGTHERIQKGTIRLSADDLADRARWHHDHFIRGLHSYQALRNEVLHQERVALRLDEFKPRPLSSFVRNKLINDIYLPIIGDNLAKQMGTVGANKRSDLMGLLMMISPPGYGKTTLMEYVAHRLGLIFMKINGPALGHEVRSIDPAQAPDATSRQELEKLNLALEMGSNVMLYVDDIQHTHPEFLQKFISLCDGTRRIEGVWRGQTRTYDMRGKKFCVVMAGNPYTESGEVFKIPDMLANRADIYNLGDVLGGMEEAFKLSYIENSLSANAILAPLATRDLSDLYKIIDHLNGKPFSANNLSHTYSAAELRDIEGTLQRMLTLREVVYRVNQQYIASAAQADAYRTEPAFRLQGSYRNMNKLAEKVSSVMNEQEMQQLIADHYVGESQLLTTGAEENLLKLAEIRQQLSDEQAARWAHIKREYLRNKAIGGSDSDTAGKIVAQLMDLVEVTRQQAQQADSINPIWPQLLAQLQQWSAQQQAHQQTLSKLLISQKAPHEKPAATPAKPDLTQALKPLVNTVLQPLTQHFEQSQKQQLGLHRVLLEIAERLRAIAQAESATVAQQSEQNIKLLEKAFNTMTSDKATDGKK